MTTHDRLEKLHQDLLAEKARFRAVFETTMDGMLITDDTGRYIDANPSACALLGMKRENIIGRSVEDFSDPRRKEEVRAMWRQFLEQGSQNGVFRIFRPDGSTRHVDYIARAHILPHENLAILRDITERDQKERSLRESEDRLRLAVDSTEMGMWDFNPLTRELKLSPRCKALFGLAPEASVSYESWLEHVHPQDRHRMQQAVRRSLDPAGEGEYDVEFRSVWPPHCTRWVVAKGRCFFEGEGERRHPTRFIGLVLDATEMKKTESELLSAKEAAEAGTKAKSQFMANISHEIRTPINGILGTLELLRQTSLTSEQREYADMMSHSSETLGALVNEFLDFSRVEAGKLKLENKRIDLLATLDTVLDLFAHRVQFKKLELMSRLEKDVPCQFRGDPVRLRQVLTNLIGNALKFTEEGEVSVAVEVEKQDKSHIVLRFSIQDTGPGIPVDQQSRLFQPFSQTDSSVSRLHTGTGLGLAISKQLVESMGGRIGVRSAAGQGSTFWFSLPFQKQSGPLFKESLVPGLRGLRILVVGNTVQCRAMAGPLIERGSPPETASSHRQALQCWKRSVERGHPFDIVFIDQTHSPEEKKSLVRLLRKTHTGLRTRFVLVGFIADRPDLNVLESEGISVYLSKPLRYSDWRACLDKVAYASRKAVRPVAPGRSERKVEDRGIPRPSMSRPILSSAAKILVAEDNLINRIVAVRQLEKLGYAADTAADGHDVLKALRKRTYDLVLMDCQMPQLDGYRTTTEIRRIEKGRRTPIVAMTAHAMEEDREKCLAVGMDDYISKPVQLAALRRLLHRHLVPSIPAPVDVQKLKQVASADDDEFDKLIHLYMQDTLEKIGRLERAIRSHSVPRIKEIAHSALGASRMLGMDALAEFFQQFEELGSHKEMHKAKSLLMKTRDALQRTQTYLRDLKHERPSSSPLKEALC